MMSEPRNTRDTQHRQEPDPDGHQGQADHRPEIAFWSIFMTLVVIAIVVTLYAARIAEFPGDLGIMEAIQRIRSVPLDYVMLAVTDLGFEPQIIITTIVAAIAFWLFRLRTAAICVLLVLLGDLIGTGLKIVIARPRPPEEFLHAVTPRIDFGFPSGHALHAVLFYGFIAFIIWYHVPNLWWRLGAVAGLALLALMTGMSRIYLGAHWPSDVVGGFVIGAVFLMALAKLYTWLVPTRAEI